MGAVFRARDGSGREVALKIVTGQLSEIARQRFEREGRLTASLRHSGIVRVHAAGEINGVPYLSYGLLEGARSLDVATADCSREEGLRLLEDAATALGYAHAEGVVHRDLKPENILVVAGKPVLVDFGVAWVHDAESLTRTGVMVGTPSHMAPEQLRGEPGETHGPATDVWALGVLLYELLTGEPPFRGDTLIEHIVIVTRRLPKPPRSLDATISKAVAWVCLKALEKRPERRFADASAFASALASARRGVTPAGLSRRQRRRRVVLAAAVTLACVGLLLFTVPPWRASRALARCSAFDLRLAQTWGVGLVDPAAAPAVADVEEALGQLEAARELLSGPEHECARRLAGRLRARVQRLAGEPPTNGASGGVALDYVVAGVRALEDDDLSGLRRASEASLRLAPDLLAARLLGLELEVREQPATFIRKAALRRREVPPPAFARLANTLVGLGYRTALASKVVSAGPRLAANAQALGISPSDHRRLKRDALRAELMRLTSQAAVDVRAAAEGLSVVAGLASAEPVTRGIPGADLALRAILDAIRESGTASELRLTQAIDAQDAGAKLGLAPDPRLLELLWAHRMKDRILLSTPHRQIALACVRYGFPLHETLSHRRTSQWILSEDVARLAKEYPRSRAVRFLQLAQSLPNKYSKWKAATQPELAKHLSAIEATLEDDLEEDLSQHYAGELHLLKAMALGFVGADIDLAKAELAPARALARNDGLRVETFAWLFTQAPEAVDGAITAQLAAEIERLRARVGTKSPPYMLDETPQALARALLLSVAGPGGLPDARFRLRIYEEVEGLIPLSGWNLSVVRSGQILAHLELGQLEMAADCGDEVVRFVNYANAIVRLRLAQDDREGAVLALERARRLASSPEELESVKGSEALVARSKGE